MNGDDFYTFSESMKKDDSALTPSMEDYLEMIYRLALDAGFTRIHDLSRALNIQPSSATKMVQRLAQMGYIQYEKYGYLMLEPSGKKLGSELLKRHRTIDRFLRLIGVEEEKVLEETEKIEHTISKETLDCFERFLKFIDERPQIYQLYSDFKKNSDSNKT